MPYYESDEEIINQYKNGNEEVFKELVEKYTSPLYNFVVRFVGKNNTPDIIQEIFIKVWKNLHKFNEEKASFKTWIFTIAKNTVTDFLRRKKSFLFSDIREEDENDSFAESIPDTGLLPDEALQKLQDSDLLNKLLEKIPVHQKTILILHYQEDMTFDEISKVLEKPLNTVKSHHYRAIVALRKMLN